MTTSGETGQGLRTRPTLATGEEVQGLAPYLGALRLVRADLLAQEIQGERSPSRIDREIDLLLDRYYDRLRNVSPTDACA